MVCLNTPLVLGHSSHDYNDVMMTYKQCDAIVTIFFKSLQKNYGNILGVGVLKKTA